MYSVVDIETTGGKSASNRITEIAIVKTDGYEILDQFSSLVNPHRSIDKFVVQLTGITDEMVATAPKFRDIATKATKVEIYQGDDKPSKVYYVGNATNDHQGTYMVLEIDGVKSTVPFVMFIPGNYGYLTSRFFTEAQQWRDAIVFKYAPEAIKSIEINYLETPEQSFVINNKEGQFLLSEIGSEKPLKVKGRLFLLTSRSTNDRLPVNPEFLTTGISLDNSSRKRSELTKKSISPLRVSNSFKSRNIFNASKFIFP